MRYLAAAVLIIATLIPAFVLADRTNGLDIGPSSFVPLAQYSGSRLQGLYGNATDLSGFINAVFEIALSIGAMLAVLRLVYAGYVYMGSGAGWSSMQKARGIIANVVFGLLLLLAIYLILYQINPCILNLNILRHVNGGGNTTC